MSNMLIALAGSAALAGCGQPPPESPPAPVPPATTAAPVPKAPAPAVKPGMPVLDRSGAQIGKVQTVTETPGGLNVVVEIEGKLVGVPPAGLELRGETVVSSQSKAQILANAGAPP